MRLTSPQKRLLEADETTRKAERSSYTGNPQSETKLLAQRIRSGELSRKNVAVAAALGYEPAKPLGEIELAAKNFREMIQSALKASDLSREEIASFAADCAEQVLPVFEKERPNDNRPRAAIEAARGGGTSAETRAGRPYRGAPGPRGPWPNAASNAAAAASAAATRGGLLSAASRASSAASNAAWAAF